MKGEKPCQILDALIITGTETFVVQRVRTKKLLLMISILTVPTSHVAENAQIITNKKEDRKLNKLTPKSWT